MKKIFVALCFLVTVLVVSTAWGHMLWINVSDYSPKVGTSVEVEIGWGHKFPKDEIVKEERLDKVYALDPSGNSVALKPVSTGRYRLAIEQKGVYLIYAQIHPGVYTKTTEGYKRQNKKGLDNALHCVSYDMRAKAIVQAGGDDRGLSHETSDFIDVVPLDDPASFKEGDTLPLKVTYKGEPLFRDFIHATYNGFSEEDETFAFSTMVKREGTANIKLLKKGAWLIKVPHKRPYPDQKECDELFHCMTLTFEIQ